MNKFRILTSSAIGISLTVVITSILAAPAGAAPPPKAPIPVVTALTLPSLNTMLENLSAPLITLVIGCANGLKVPGGAEVPEGGCLAGVGAAMADSLKAGVIQATINNAIDRASPSTSTKQILFAPGPFGSGARNMI